MADLGALATRVSGTSARGSAVPTWAYSIIAIEIAATMRVPVNGRIYGTLTEAGAGVFRRPVRCYHRVTGNLVARALTDANGAYEFLDLDPGDVYTIVAIDSTDTYNAVVQDNVAPDSLIAGAARVVAGASGAVTVV